MRSEAEIRKRLSSILGAEVDRRLAEVSSRLPHLCVHNYRHALDVRKQVEGVQNSEYNRIEHPTKKTIGLCMLGADDHQNWNGTICEDPIDAQRCPYFQLKATKADTWRELAEQLSDASWLEKNMPEVQELLWCLGEKPPRLSWWRKFRFMLSRVKTEPVVVQSVDLDKMLPP